MGAMRVFASAVCLFVCVGCGGGSSTPAPADTGTTGTSSTTSSTSGGCATISTGSKVYGFIPLNGTVVTAQLQGSSSADVSAAKGAGLKSVTSSTTSFIVDSCAADGTALKVVCVGYLSSQVAILDISSFVTKLIAGETPTTSDITVVEVDLGNTVTADFSGGSCLNCGVLTDPGDSRFIVSSGDGYRVLNYSDNATSGTATVSKSYLSDATATPVRSMATENFAFDPTNNRIISPEYEGIAGTNQYLWIADLAADKLYRWTKRMVDVSADASAGLTGLSAAFPSGLEADAAAIDAGTGVLVLADEGQNGLLTVNLTGATFDDTALTFDASYTVVEQTSMVSRLPGIGVEPSGHILFMEEELGGSGVGVTQLPTSAASGALSITSYNSATMPDPSATCPGVTSWANAGDPHGLALFTGVVDSKPKGLLINSSKDCAAIVDLEGLLGALKGTGTNTVDSSVDLLTSGIVTYVSLQ